MGLIDKLKNAGKLGAIAVTSFMPFSYVEGAQEFIRGDVDGDGKITLTDSVKTLNSLFKGGQKPDCEDAMDVNDDGKIDLGDAVHGLGYLFRGGSAPVSPFPERGYDITEAGLTADALDCRGFRGAVLLNKGSLTLDKPDTLYKLMNSVEGGYRIEGERAEFDGQKYSIILTDTTEKSGIDIRAKNVMVKDLSEIFVIFTF